MTCLPFSNSRFIRSTSGSGRGIGIRISGSSGSSSGSGLTTAAGVLIQRSQNSFQRSAASGEPGAGIKDGISAVASVNGAACFHVSLNQWFHRSNKAISDLKAILTWVRSAPSMPKFGVGPNKNTGAVLSTGTAVRQFAGALVPVDIFGKIRNITLPAACVWRSRSRVKW